MLEIDYDLEKTETNSVISENKIKTVKAILSSIHESLGRVIELLNTEDELTAVVDGLATSMSGVNDILNDASSGSILEGVFDGEKMISQDGKVFQVPPNYASKSKLIEGDILKLTITSRGTHLYKQISPVDRKRVVGTLSIDETSGSYYVMTESLAYKVIPASVTFYKGEIGDEVILLVPKDGTSAWAAIENIIKK